jgi:hypothetical protein
MAANDSPSANVVAVTCSRVATAADTPDPNLAARWAAYALAPPTSSFVETTEDGHVLLVSEGGGGGVTVNAHRLPS